MTTLNFQSIYNQMEQQINKDDSIFVFDSNNQQHIRLIDPTRIYNRPLNPIEAKMIQNIANVDQYSWERDERGGLTTGFPLFDEALEGGAQPGLYLFASQANVGKSAWMLQAGQQIADLNENVHVAYHSLDDSLNELTPRYIACKQQITISQAKNPAKYREQPEIIAKRNEGVKHLYRSASKFSMWDANEGTSVEVVENRIKEMKMSFPEGTKLVIMIDSIYDLTVESKQLQDKALYEYVAKTVKGWTVAYDVIVMCTAHLRKLNGGRRPDTSDLKENNRLEYEANFIALLYNEVGLKEEGAEIYWLSEESESKMPVIEMKVGKNKFSSFKGTRFYEFLPDMSYLLESPIEDCRRYASLIHQS
ncbi:DnaB-like helicase C-terminal domain-containing protein [Priestia megaterium]